MYLPSVKTDPHFIQNLHTIILHHIDLVTKFNKFDLIITSPPYNIGKSYETKTSIEKYLETQEEIIHQFLF